MPKRGGPECPPRRRGPLRQAPPPPPRAAARARRGLRNFSAPGLTRGEEDAGLPAGE